MGAKKKSPNQNYNFIVIKNHIFFILIKTYKYILLKYSNKHIK